LPAKPLKLIKMKQKRFIRKFVLRLERDWLFSKNRGSLTKNEVEILESCLETMKQALDEKEKELEKALILDATKKLLMLPFIKFNKS
jgi:hypothetical protein